MHNETKKPAIKQEAVPDMEDSPPVSDSDVSTRALGFPDIAGYFDIGRTLTLSKCVKSYSSSSSCVQWSCFLSSRDPLVMWGAFSWVLFIWGWAGKEVTPLPLDVC